MPLLDANGNPMTEPSEEEFTVDPNDVIEYLRGELTNREMMLGHVLRTTGDVSVTKESLEEPFEEGQQICIDDTGDAFLFRLGNPDASN